MKWARARLATGETQFGVITGDMFEPRSALGADDAAGDPMSVADVTLLPPVVPGKFIGLWNNFKAAAEKNGNEHPSHPLYFFKADTSLSGPGARVALPRVCRPRDLRRRTWNRHRQSLPQCLAR